MSILRINPGIVMDRNLVESICVRVPKGLRKQFQDKSRLYGSSSSEIHRELLTAFIEERMAIIAPLPDEPLRSLYD